MAAGALGARPAWVRNNALRTALADADLEAVAPVAARLRFPKVESAEDAPWVVDRCGADCPPVICVIESARGLLARAVQGVRHLLIGGVDLGRDLNRGADDLPMLHAVFTPPPEEIVWDREALEERERTRLLGSPRIDATLRKCGCCNESRAPQ